MLIKIDKIHMTSMEDIDEESQKVINDLADSIKEVGLSHPIIVRPANISGEYILVSGAKRLLAYKSLEKDSIEAESREISENTGKIIRVHENLKRKNLPWYDQAALVETLHSLRQSEHGGKSDPGRPAKAEGKKWGIRETASELGVALGSLSENINLARAVRTDPSLKNIKDKKTAIKLVRRKQQRMEAEIEATMPTEDSYNQAFLGDAADILKQFPDKTFDHCITDPPWIKFFDKTLTIDRRTLPVLKEVYRVLKPNSFLLMFCGLDDYAYYCGHDKPTVFTKSVGNDILHAEGKLEEIGFTVSKTPSIWQKLSALSRRGVKSWEYDRDFEFVIVAVKGSPNMTYPTVVSAIKSFKAVPPRSLAHPNEKPKDLIKSYLEDISYQGNLILDPFGGSFVTAEACRQTGRRWIVCERDQKAYKKGCKRLKIKE